MKKILAFGASSSKNSINKQLATYAAVKTDLAYTIIDLNDFEMPIFSVDKEETNGIPKEATDFKQLVKDADGIIISFAEHNGSYSSAFKNLMDWASRVEKSRWNNKPMMLLSTSPGARGGKNVLDHALGYFPYMDANIISSFSLPSFYENFKENNINHESLAEDFSKALTLFKSKL